jgi:16S rRNA (uracil1498-N3)-methyltransferase
VDTSTPTLLAVGPEGGFIDAEVARFMALGFQPIQLGQRILRVETAIPVLLAKLF